MQKSLTTSTKFVFLAILSVTLFFLSFNLSSAEDTATTPSSPGITPPRAVLRDANGAIIREKMDARRDIVDLKKNLKAKASTTGTSTKKELRDDLRQDIKDRKAQASTTINRIRDDRNEKMKAGLSLVRGRFTTALERFDKIIVRLESRMAKLKDAGADVSKEVVLIDSAKTLLAKVRTDVSTITTQANQIASSTSPKIQFEKIKSQATLIQESLKKTRKILTEVTVMLAKERRLNKGNASTTSTTN